MEGLDLILYGLMKQYKERVPDVAKVTNAMVDQKVISSSDEISNDHIAFRTMGVPHLGIHSLSKVFLKYGYEKKDHFFFEGKRLDAFWYAPPDPRYPRIFISELRVQDLPKSTQDIIFSYTQEVSSDPVDELDLNDGNEVSRFLHQPLWRLPSWDDYQALQKVSEYAAWVIYNRYYLNHYTISVHDLRKGYSTINEFNCFLESIGIVLNDSGGKIKISKDGLLQQSSTVSQLVEAKFKGGVKKMIPGSYVEFCERKVLPEFKHLSPDQIKRKHRRDGFETGNADKIFESTYLNQTKKRD
ncbi:MAG: DUF1338 domain-containing protein [Flavobacteriales bacterium]|nr:DUF1338 domain-containing protein [Flavobacteriales bacterium]|tara:strand:- start:23693 stop:24589 length:897 start_codon:yes stop_codon:yes gene_type:complete